MSPVEKEAARAEQAAEETAGRLRDTSVALLEANQELAKIPILEHRVQEVWEARQWFADQNAELLAENERLREENERLEASIRRLEES